MRSLPLLVLTLVSSLLFAGLNSLAEEEVAGVLRCAPLQLYRDDTLDLEMTLPHGVELAVNNPAGTFYFLVYRPNGPGLPPTPRMTIEEFKDVREIKISPLDFTAWPYRAGTTDWERVFTRDGDYEFRLAYSLQTDAGGPIARCTVHYTDKPRPAR